MYKLFGRVNRSVIEQFSVRLLLKCIHTLVFSSIQTFIRKYKFEITKLYSISESHIFFIFELNQNRIYPIIFFLNKSLFLYISYKINNISN